MHLRDVQEPSHEWGAALTEDLLSHKFRRFLTVDKKEFVAIRAAFDVFDADASGSIDSNEFQSLCFEIGEVSKSKKRRRSNVVVIIIVHYNSCNYRKNDFYSFISL